MGATMTMSDGCQWTYWADVIYTSGASHIPTQTYPGNQFGAGISHLAANYQADLWNDREYVAGQNGESKTVVLQAHFDYTFDEIGYAPEGALSREGLERLTHFYHLIVTTAPGESFRDTLTSRTPLAGYDPTKGVALHNTTRGSYAAGIEIRDNFVDLIGLQIKSDYEQGVGGGETHGANSASIQSSIIDGGAANDIAAVMIDSSGVIANSLIIVRGMHGVEERYPGIILHSTLVNPDRVPGSVAVASHGPWVFNGPVVSNTAIFGFTHAAQSWNEEGKIVWGGGNNVTDAPPGDSGSGHWSDAHVATTIDELHGTAYGTPIAGVFAAFPGDYRPGPSSPLKGGGADYGPVNSNCDAAHNGCAARITFNFDREDIIRTPRPQNGRYDVGAWQSDRGQYSK